jgi:hyperosmotically inducible protein
MNKLIFLALAAGAGFGAAPAFAQDQDNNASYRAMSDKAQADYKVAKAQCDASSGNAKKVCEESAKVDLARADTDAVALYKNTPSALGDARLDLANAEYGLARAKCEAMSGNNKTLCLSDAKTAHTTALVDARDGTPSAGMNTAARAVSGTTAADCAQYSGADKAACLTRAGGSSAKNVIADTVITTKIKADLVKAPDLKAMDVHVETVKGVVTLSGFVPSQAQAARAEELARATEGVTDVQSTLQIK